jgi:hypothetical protein
MPSLNQHNMKPAARPAAANACESLCAAAYPARLAAPASANPHLWKQLLFELLTDIVSCQAICGRRDFLQIAYSFE